MENNFPEISPEALVLLKGLEVPAKGDWHPETRLNEGEWWAETVTFPEGTLRGSNAVMAEEFPKPFNQGPSRPATQIWYKLPNENVLFTAGPFATLEVWEEDIPALLCEAHSIKWQKESPFQEKWDRVE